jgi:hypothetical protein
MHALGFPCFIQTLSAKKAEQPEKLDENDKMRETKQRTLHAKHQKKQMRKWYIPKC